MKKQDGEVVHVVGMGAKNLLTSALNSDVAMSDVGFFLSRLIKI